MIPPVHSAMSRTNSVCVCVCGGGGGASLGQFAEPPIYFSLATVLTVKSRNASTVNGLVQGTGSEI